MAIFKTGALAFFHSKTVAVRGISGDKIEITIEGGASKNVREKDLEWIHAGPVTSLPPQRLEDPDFEEIAELMETETLSFSEFTELLFSQNTPAAAYSAALILKDDLYFSGSIQNGVQVKPREEIEKKLAAIREKAEAKARYEARVERLKNRAILEEDLPFMSEIEQVANGVNSSSKLMKDAGLEATEAKAHKLLLDLNVWTYKVNPYPARAGIELTDPPDDGIAFTNTEDREDLTHLTAYAIDDEGSNDPDDAIAYDFEEDVLWVHVADPAALITRDSVWDLTARERGENLYLPEGITHMLPRKMTELFGLGLTEDGISPALSFAIRIDPDSGEAALHRITLSRIRVERHIYDSAEKLFDKPDFIQIRQSLEKFRAFRAKNGALFIRLPEVKISADKNGIVSIRPLPFTPSRELVANAMLAAGAAVAKWAEQEGIPMPYVTQETPEIGDLPRENGSLPEMYALKKCCLAGVVSVQSGLHAGLGLEPYVRVTSPLRRYADLLAHQQIRKYLAGEELSGSDEIEEILKVSEPASVERRRVERFSNEYWTLVWMTQQGSGWQTDTIPVYHPDDRWFFLIPEAAYEYKNRYSGRITPGEVRRVELLKADPVQMRAQFRFVYGSTATDGEEEIIEEDYYEDEEENTEDKENTQETGKD